MRRLLRLTHGYTLYVLLGAAATLAVVFGLNAVFGFVGGAGTAAAAERTASVGVGTVQATVSASGNVTPATSASANFPTSGTLTAVHVSVGQHVKAGQVLAEIDPTSTQATLDADEANLAQAEATLQTAEAGATAAQRAQNAASLAQAESQLASARQQLSTARSTLAKDEKQLALDKSLACPPLVTAATGGGSTSGTSAASSSNGSAASTSPGGSASASSSSGTGSSAAQGSSAGNGSRSSSAGAAGAGAGSSSSAASSGAGAGGATRSTLAASPSAGGAATSTPSAPTVEPTAASTVTTTGATLTGTVNPNGADTFYWFEYGLSTSPDEKTSPQDAGSGTSAQNVSVNLSTLQPGQTYYFRLAASNENGTSRSAVVELTTPAAAAPVVSTSAATGVGLTSATLAGTVDPNSADTTYYFQYGTTRTFGQVTPTLDAGSGSAPVQVSVPLTSLRADTTYVYRLVATNASGTADGITQFFTTGTAAAAVTGQASSVTATTATLAGTVNPQGANTRYRFDYGLGSSLSLHTRWQAADGSAGSVTASADVTGLEAGKTYSFRLRATNVNGTALGSIATLTTPAAAVPTATTGSATVDGGTSLTLTGTVNANASDTHYHFEYGRTSAYSAKTKSVDAGAGTTPTQVTATVSHLKPGTTYAFRLVATSRYGTVRGATQLASTATASCTTDSQTVAADKLAIQQEEAAVAADEASVQSALATISSASTSSASTLAQDRAAVSQAQASVLTAKKALGETVLRSPVSGTVTAVNGSVGETVGGSGTSVARGGNAASASSSTGNGNGGGANANSSSSSSSGFVTIDSTNDLQIVAGFPEADATKISVGDPATVSFPALPNTEVAGRVVAVSNTSTVVSNVVTYDETIELVNPPAEVKEGMTANVSVVTETRPNVLELPSSAITTAGNVSTVQLLRNGKTTVQRIQAGLVGSSTTEVVSGLAKGDTVVLPTVSITSTGTNGTTGGGGFAGGGGGFFGGGFFRGGGGGGGG